MFRLWPRKTKTSRTPTKRVSLNVINAIELKKDSTYILVANTKTVGKEDIQTIMKDIRKAGVKNVVAFMLSGNPDEAVQFVQSNNPKRRTK